MFLKFSLKFLDIFPKTKYNFSTFFNFSYTNSIVPTFFKLLLYPTILPDFLSTRQVKRRFPGTLIYLCYIFNADALAEMSKYVFDSLLFFSRLFWKKSKAQAETQT